MPNESGLFSSSPSTLLCEHKRGVIFTFFRALREQEDKESLNFDLPLGKLHHPHQDYQASAVFSAATWLHSDRDETIKRFPP